MWQRRVIQGVLLRGGVVGDDSLRAHSFGHFKLLCQSIGALRDLRIDLLFTNTFLRATIAKDTRLHELRRGARLCTSRRWCYVVSYFARVTA